MLSESRTLASSSLRETLLGGLVLGGFLILFSRHGCMLNQGSRLFCVDPDATFTMVSLSIVGLWKFTAFLLLSYLLGLGLSSAGDVFVIEREPIERSRERIETVGLSGNDLLLEEWRRVRQFREDMRSILGAGFILLFFGLVYLSVLLLEMLAIGSAQWLTSSTNPFNAEVATTLIAFFVQILVSAAASFFFLRRVIRPWATDVYEARLKQLDALGGLPAGVVVNVDGG